MANWHSVHDEFLVSGLVDFAEKQTVQAWDNHVGTSALYGMAEETHDQPHPLDQSGSDGLSGGFFGAAAFQCSLRHVVGKTDARFG